MFDTLVFPGVSEEVVLLLAEGSGGASYFELYQARDIHGLEEIDTAPWVEHSPEDGAKWTPALLHRSLFETYTRLSEGSHFAKLKDWGRTYLGAVSGSNGFFCMSSVEAQRKGLVSSQLRKISPPGSRHLKGLSFTEAAWNALDKEGARIVLFRPEEATGCAKRLISEGEKAGVQNAYKCAARNPWWRVPLVETPDLFLTYMNHDRPRLISNDAKVDILNSLYGVSLKNGLKKIGKSLLPISSLNSMTILGAEMVGRAYGGSLLKLEPREADLLPVPSREMLSAHQGELLALKPQLAVLLRSGHLDQAVDLVDRIVLAKAAKLSCSEISSLREGRELLFQRRMARGKSSRADAL